MNNKQQQQTTRGDKLERITIKNLESQIDSINYWANSNAYFLSGAYGGYRLEKYGDHGGVIDILKIGFVPKRKLHEHLMTFKKGLITSDAIIQLITREV